MCVTLVCVFCMCCMYAYKKSLCLTPDQFLYVAGKFACLQVQGCVWSYCWGHWHGDGSNGGSKRCKNVFVHCHDYLFHIYIYIQSSLEPFQEVVAEQLLRLDAERKEQNFLTSLCKIAATYPRVTDRYMYANGGDILKFPNIKIQSILVKLITFSLRVLLFLPQICWATIVFPTHSSWYLSRDVSGAALSSSWPETTPLSGATRQRFSWHAHTQVRGECFH